jgi:hypothetical protein
VTIDEEAHDRDDARDQQALREPAEDDHQLSCGDDDERKTKFGEAVAQTA